MQLASSARIPDGFIAAMRLGGEKPHQGLPGRNPALYQGPTVCNSTTALGLRGQAELNRIGSCSTNKERDTESGNDYFLARYYNSSTGRFLSPDWSAKSDDPVPYAKLDNPQSLNLYSYVYNNPMELVDTDGHGVTAATAPAPPVTPSPTNSLMNKIETRLADAATKTVEVVESDTVEVGQAAGKTALNTAIGVGEDALGVVGFLFTSTAQAGNYADGHPNNGAANASSPAAPEPQAAAGGAGARQGGGRNEQKGNTDRAASARNNLAGAKADLESAKQMPPSKERSEKIEQAKKQMKHWQSKAAEKSENHSRKEKGQQD
jgi:RHS repeat-associated protein